MILAGDVGGTNTRLALFERQAGGLRQVVTRVYPSRQYPGLEMIMREFMAAEKATITAAACGIAGPVRNGRCEATNLPWVVVAAEVATALELPSFRLLNDLEASARGLGWLSPADFLLLHPGEEQPGNRALISAGTGLGEAGLFWDGREHRAFATEGGHCDFAPRDELEAELWRWLGQSLAHVSYEQVISGPGLFRIYQFLRATGRGREEPFLTAELAAGDPPAVIAGAALQNKSPLATAAVDLFIGLYGAEAGNLALKCFAVGGVYVGGGIAPKLVSRLDSARFREAFFAKGRLRAVLERIPLRVVLNDNAALLGAAHAAEG